MRAVFQDLSHSFRNPEFWALSSWLDVVASYRRTRLGIFWMMAPVMLYVWGVGGFFAGLYGKTIPAFGAHVALGVTVFRLVTSVVTEATTVFTGSQAFILDGHLRLTDFILRVLAKAMLYFFVSLPVVVVALWMYPGLQPAALPLSLLGFLLVLLNAAWIGTVMALLGARYPDISQLTGSILLFAFLLTPIVWYSEMAPATGARAVLMQLNPLFHMVEIVRAPLLGEAFDMRSLQVLTGMAAAGWLAAAWSYQRYARFVPIWV